MASKLPKKRARLDAAAKGTALSSSSNGNNVGGPSLCQSTPPNCVTAYPKVSQRMYEVRWGIV